MSRGWSNAAARLLAAGLLLAGLAGCATPPRPVVPADLQVWTGRLALTVDGQQRQAFSAAFELKGEPEAGTLTLYSPLGGTLAVMAWADGAASLRTNGEARQYPSLAALSAEVTGAEIPVTALFDWLAGKPTPVPGWQVDVAQVAQGRLRAQRSAPPPPTDLRIAFDR